MADGPGAYDYLCTHVRESAEATGALVMVFNGNLGSGFSVQAPSEIHAQLADVLEQVVQQMRARNTKRFGH
nr:hypothetical protein [uncultured Roseateles sp.]